MAKVNSLIDFQGTIGGITFYLLNGELVARKAGGGFNRNAIKNKKSMKLVRLQNSEFALAANANKQLRHAMGFLWGNFKLTFLHSRMQGMMQRIKTLDKGAGLGKRDAFRGMLTAEGLAELQQFTYTPDAPLSKILPYTAVLSEDAATVSLALLEGAAFAPVEGATHVSLRMGVAVLNEAERCVERFGSGSMVLPLGNLPEVVDLTTDHPVTGEGPKLVFLRAWYGKEEDGNMVHFRQKGALGFGVVGVKG